MLLGQVAAVQPPQVSHGNEVVNIIVGPEEHEFVIHKNLICASSGFFHAAFTGHFIEGSKQQACLLNLDPHLFQLVYDWLYSGRIVDDPSIYMKKEEDACSADEFWWEIFCVGDFLLMDDVRALAVAKLQDLFSMKEPLIPSKEFIARLFAFDSARTLETYIIEHIICWMEKSEDPGVWTALSDAHERFGEELNIAIVESQSWKPVHHDPGVFTDTYRLEGYMSPYYVAGLKEPGISTGCDSRIAERQGKLLHRAKLIQKKVELQ